MPQRQRCAFELQFCGLSSPDATPSFDAYRIVIEHRHGKKKYGATPAFPASAGAANAAAPPVHFSCGVYAAKCLSLRLMGGTQPPPPAASGSGRGALTRSNSQLQWQQLATAPLPLGQLAPTSSSSSTAAAAAACDDDASGLDTPLTATSTRGSSMDRLATSTPGGAGGENDDAESDSGQLFCSTDSLAAAAASLAAQQQQQQQGVVRRTGSAVSDDAASAHTAAAVSGMWVAGDSQVTRLTIQWRPQEGSPLAGAASAIEQEVVVIAKLLEARPSLSNLFGLLKGSPSKTSLTAQPPSPLGTPRRGAGGVTPRAGSAATLADTHIRPDLPVLDQGVTATPPAARQVTFVPVPTFSSPATTQHQQQQGPELSLSQGAPGGDTPGAAQAAAAEAAAEEEEDQEAAKHDFLQLILSTLASASSIDSEVAGAVVGSAGDAAAAVKDSIMLSASPAQLAAAASLPRAPSVKDLAVFAAAAGLSFETVSQAAASTRLSVTDAHGGSGSSSRGSSFRLAPRPSRGNGSSASRGSPVRQVIAATLDTSPNPSSSSSSIKEGTAQAGGDGGNSLLAADASTGPSSSPTAQPAAPAGPEQQQQQEALLLPASNALPEGADVGQGPPTPTTAPAAAAVNPRSNPGHAGPAAAATRGGSAHNPVPATCCRLRTVLSARQPSLNLRRSLSLSRSSSGAAPGPSVNSNNSSSSSMVAAVLAPAAGAVLATSGAAAAAAVTAGTTTVTTAATAGVAVGVFALRQAAGLFQFGGRVAVSAVFAAPRAAAWAAQRAWSLMASSPSLQRHTVSTAAAGNSDRQSEAASPAAADMHAAAQAAATTAPSSSSSSSNDNNTVQSPSVGGTAASRWAPAAGRSTAASLAVAAISPLALLLQWPLRTATILFEVWVWGLAMLLGAPLAMPLGLLRYLGLLPQRLPGPPTASSVQAAGGFAAQAGTGRQSGQAAALAGAAAADSVSTSAPRSVAAVPEEQEVSGEDLSPAVAGGGGGGRVSRPMPLTPAPSMEMPGSSSSAQRTWSVSFLAAALNRLGSTGLAAAAPTDSPSSLTASSGSSSASSTAAPAAGASPVASRAASAASASGLGGGGPRATRGLSRLSRRGVGVSYPAAGDSSDTGIGALSSRSSSSGSSMSRTSSASSSSTGSLGLLGRRAISGSRWLGGRRVAAATGLASNGPAVSTGVMDGSAASGSRSRSRSSSSSWWWWPRWTPRADDDGGGVDGTRDSAAVAAAQGTDSQEALLPATPPSTPMLASFTDSGSQPSRASSWPWSHLRPLAAAAAAAAAETPTAAALPGSADAGTSAESAELAAGEDGGGGAGIGLPHAQPAAPQAVQPAGSGLLVLQPALWLWGALVQLVSSGVETAAWLAGWAIWWATLPARLAWWGVTLPGRAAWRMGAAVWWLVAGREGGPHAAEVIGVDA